MFDVMLTSVMLRESISSLLADIEGPNYDPSAKYHVSLSMLHGVHRAGQLAGQIAALRGCLALKGVPKKTKTLVLKKIEELELSLEQARGAQKQTSGLRILKDGQ